MDVTINVPIAQFQKLAEFLEVIVYKILLNRQLKLLQKGLKKLSSQGSISGTLEKESLEIKSINTLF